MTTHRVMVQTNLAIGVAMATIFAIDLNTPLGLAVPFLYLLVALIAIAAAADQRALVAIAVLGPVLAVVKLLLIPFDGITWYGHANRVIFSLLIWIAVGLEWGRRLLEARRIENSLELERLVEERTEDLNTAKHKLELEIAERKDAESTIVDYTQRLHALTNQLVEAQEAERKALATELHDRIGQNLSVLNMSLNLHLELLSEQLPPAALKPAQMRIKDALALVERTTEVVRGVMEELHPALLEQYGLDTAIRWYGEEFSRRTGIDIKCTTGDRLPRLRAKVETTLFRIVQEALTNVAKHAKATVVLISLEKTTAGITLLISDNGVGIAAEKLSPPAAGSSWGLTIMTERARTIGAQLRIERGDDKGTNIVVTAPIAPNGLRETE